MTLNKEKSFYVDYGIIFGRILETVLIVIGWLGPFFIISVWGQVTSSYYCDTGF